MPIARSRSKRSRMPPFTMSLRYTTPSTRGRHSAARPRRAVYPPCRAIDSTTGRVSGGSPRRLRDPAADRVAAPLRTWRPSRSTPLIRVVAVNGTNVMVRLAVLAGGGAAAKAERSFASTTMLRPSGVSSGSDASWARSASSSTRTPATGRNSTACRLPSVIVPVLSSSSVFTSPAASTARPLIAITFCWIRRSMPAMPMAESSPPMVVGMRQTSSAMSTGIADRRRRCRSRTAAA